MPLLYPRSFSGALAPLLESNSHVVVTSLFLSQQPRPLLESLLMGLQAATELALVVENFPEARLESFVAATAVDVNKSGLDAYSTALTWDIEMRPITDTPFPPYITFLNIRYWAISMAIGVRREHDLKA
ncbi:MAG: hypothetical protein M1813_008495 [Trichoglossum hirsutum]|nr:MAG: hypothetical protein M1813_008495 [Trichoglossum hirsutum]